MEAYNNKAIQIMNEVNKVVIGKRVIIGKVLQNIVHIGGNIGFSIFKGYGSEA